MDIVPVSFEIHLPIICLFRFPCNYVVIVLRMSIIHPNKYHSTALFIDIRPHYQRIRKLITSFKSVSVFLVSRTFIHNV